MDRRVRNIVISFVFCETKLISWYMLSCISNKHELCVKVIRHNTKYLVKNMYYTEIAASIIVVYNIFHSKFAASLNIKSLKSKVYYLMQSISCVLIYLVHYLFVSGIFSTPFKI